MTNNNNQCDAAVNYGSIHQLNKKEDGKERKPIFPVTPIQAVYDARTGASLEAILAQFNAIYVQYQGTPEATRNIIPDVMRRAGLTITYMDMESNTITERANSAVQKDNDHWGLDVNWSRVDELSLSGDISVSSKGTWIINGKDTGVKALGPKGDTGLTPWLMTFDNKLHYSYDNVTWEPCSENIAAWFRFNATSSDSQSGTIGRIQISRDNKTWTDLSPEFRNYLRIQGYVATTSALPANQVVGTIYGVGPTYAVDDTAHTNPIYRLHVWNGTSWVDNGKFTSIAAGVVQETGDSETEVMSQKAVSEKLSELGSNVSLGLFNVDVNSLFSNNEQVYSNYIEVKQGDLISFKGKADSVNGVLFEYNSDKQIISLWTAKSGSRTINVEKEDAAYVRVVYDKENQGQYLIKNGTTVSKFNYVDEVLSALNSKLLGINNHIIENYMTSYPFEVNVGDVIEWRSDLSNTDNTLLFLDEKFNKIDQWTSPSKYRRIIMDNTSCKYIIARFNPYSSSIQCLSINNVIVADFIDIRLKETVKNIKLVYNAPLVSDLFDDGVVLSDFISCSKGSIVEFSAKKDAIYAVVTAYDSNYKIIDTWTNATGQRNFTIEDENIAFIQIKYDTNDKRPQYTKVDEILVSELKPNDYNISLLGNKTDNSINIPDWVQAEAFKTFSRMINYTNSNSFVLAQITDVHSGGNNKYKHVGYLNELNKVWSFNVLCNAGDIGLDVGETDDDALKLMYNTKSLMNCTSPWLFCKGNHERLRTMSELGNVFMKPSRRQFPNIVFGDNNGLYGYIDDEISKVRTIYINTSDTDSHTSYAISDEQIVWLGNTLFSTNDDYKVVILTHLCPKQIGEWTDYPGDWETASNLVKVIEGFAQRQSVSHAGITWDYTNKLAKIVCVLSGDSHFNNFTKENGVNYIVRQGYGGISESSKPDGATSDSFSYTNQCLFDVLVVKDDSTAKVFRIGAGGELRDLEITF